MNRDAYAPPPSPRPQSLSRRELLRLRLNRSDIDHDGYERLVREQWEGVDREPLLRALEPVTELLATHDVSSAFEFALGSRPLQTARELVEACQPGGTVALAAWTPRGLPGALEEYIDRPAGIPSPALWGHEPRARRRLEPLLDELVIRTRTVTLDFPSPAALFGQIVAPRRAEALRPAFERLLAATNNCPPAAVINARYLLITGMRRA